MKYLIRYWYIALPLLLAAFFRFYRFTDFQYWSPDEEILAAVTLPMALGRKLLLISPNATLAISLGPFFHWLTALIYIIGKFDPIKILAAGSFFGVITTFLIFITGNIFGNKKVGIFASLFYAGSFVAGLFDRRWWPLSLDPLLITTSVISLLLLQKKKYWAIVPLTICASFSFHADPSLVIILPATICIFLIFRLPLFKKEYICGLLVVIIFMLPVILFEFRHPGSITSPVFQMVTKEKSPSASYIISPLDFIGYLSRGFFPVATDRAEEYMATYIAPNKMFPNTILIALTLLLITFPILKIRDKRLNGGPLVVILYVFLGSFFFGIMIFGLITKYAIYQQYFVVIWPVVFLLAGLTIYYLWVGRLGIIALLILSIFIILNLQAIFYSRMIAPLSYKVNLVDSALRQVSSSYFSLEISKEEDTYLGGIGGIFYLRGRYPNNLSYYRNWDWVYRSYSLYGPNLGIPTVNKIYISVDKVLIKPL